MGDPLAGLQAALAGRYRVEGEVGKGGMGVVYLAHDLKHGRAVAIKVLRPEVAAALGPERFLREIGIAAQLSHPHIVPLHDSGEAAGYLYYVMPFVTGETLRDKLEREGPLPIDEALRITRQVAAALAHAHGRGVVHRDIKPSNILLSEGFALVADFGLARAVRSGDPGLEISSVGLPIGTPRYMSPEQALGAPGVDGRSDLYALGRVLSEMLQGRDDISLAVRQAVSRCTALDPAQRYGSADELIAALGARGAEPAAPRRRALQLGAVVVVLGLAGWGLWRLIAATVLAPSSTGLDTTRIAVLPFAQLPGTPHVTADVLVRNGLTRWSGVTVVPGLQLSEALPKEGAGDMDRSAALKLAREVRAGRFIRGQVVPYGDSVQLEAVLFDTRAGTPLLEQSVRVPRNLAGINAAAELLVDSLLFRGAIPLENFAAPRGTMSIAAMSQFIAGREAMAQWDLARADSGFSHALALDPKFSRAALWLAQVRMWQGQPAVTWRAAAALAFLGRAELGGRDTALASVVLEAAQDQLATACPRFVALTRDWPAEFPVWYGAANCLGRDNAVERDSRSPSGWRFRTSYQQAQNAWRRAFTLMPIIYRDFRAGVQHGSQWLLWTAPNRGRLGSAVPPDTGRFMARPTWQADSLAFVPIRLAEYTSGQAVRTKAMGEAVTHQRLAFHDLVVEWASADPRNLEAREAVALSLWSLGSPAATDSMRAARADARTARDRVRLGVSETLMHVFRGVGDSAELLTARRIADSLIGMAQNNPDIDSWDLATVASLTGRATLAVHFVRLASPRSAWILPPALTRDALAFLVFATLGGPVDSLRSLESRVADGIAAGIDPTTQREARLEWLGRPTRIAALDVQLASLGLLAGGGDYLIDAEVAQLKGDTTTAMRLLRRAAFSRRFMEPADLSLEGLLPESRLLAAIGDRTAAAQLLDPTLADLSHASLQMIGQPLTAGLLVRAMAFRSELARAAGDSAGARKWGRAVRTLWSSADSFLSGSIH